MSSTNVATNYLSPYTLEYHNVTDFADSLDQIETIANYFTTVAEFHQIKISSKLMVGSSDDPGDYYLEVHGESIFKKYNLDDDLLLTVEGSANIDNVLTVSGESYFLSDVSMEDNLYVLDNVDVSNDVYIHKNLHVDQDASINELYVYGNSTLDNLTTLETLEVTNTSNFVNDVSFQMNVYIDDNLDVSGDSTFENHVQINKTLDVIGLATLDNMQVSEDISFIGVDHIFRIEPTANFINKVNFYDDVTIDGKTLDIKGTTGTCNIDGTLTVPKITCSVITADTFQKSGLYTQELNKLYLDYFEGYQDLSGDTFSLLLNTDGTYIDIDGITTYSSGYDDSGNIISTLDKYIDVSGIETDISYVYQRGIMNILSNSDVYISSTTQIQNDLIIGSNLYLHSNDGNNNFIKVTLAESGNDTTTITDLNNYNLEIEEDLNDTSLNIVASQGTGTGIYYDGNVTIGNPTHSETDISNNSGRELTLYGDIRIKHGGELIIEDGTMTDLTIEKKFSDVLNIQNIGTGPGVTVNQWDATHHDIIHFQDNSDNVFVVGAEGNTIISGKLHIGIDKSLITGSGSIGNNNNDEEGIYNDFDIKGISKNDASYNFYVNGNTLIKDDLDISGSFYLDDYFQMNTIQQESIFQINDISGYTSGYSFDVSTVVITKHENMNTTTTPIMYLGRTGVANSGYAELSICQYETNNTQPRVKMEFNLDNTTANDKTNVLTLTAEDGGYVGINNNTPQYNLDVNGTIQLDGEIEFRTGSNIDFKSGVTTFNTPVTINDDISINSTFNINHDTSFNENVDITENLVIHKEFKIFDGNSNFFTNIYGVTEKCSKINYSNTNIYIENVGGEDIVFKTNDTERVVIFNNGDVSFNHSIQISDDVTVGGTMMSSSDRRIKTNIAPLENCLDKIDGISGYQYNRTDLIDTTKLHVGVIAQDVEEVYPELVETNKSDIKQVNYNSLIAVLVECVKELKEENKELKERIINLENK